MENTNGDFERKIPPRSKFNDEEATGILRLIVEQEKLLKNATVGPVLNVNIAPNRQKRLPPLNARSESLDENDFENVRSRKTLNDLESEIFLSKPTLLRGKDFRTYDEDASLPGIPSKIPDIYSSPKMARHRERPKGSYGRSQENLRGVSRSSNKSRSLESCANLQSHELIVERPTNPILKDDLQNYSNSYYPSGDAIGVDEKERPCVSPKRVATPSYIN